tara:strand:+ start:1386 stop:2102 length:717 start_codon:yes stop_codon:yes gene_type:complete
MKLITFLILSSFTLMANNQNDRFDSKVKYEYNVYLEVLNLKLGEASLSIKEPGTIDGVNVYHFNFTVRTTKLGDTIYKIRNKIDVWVNQENLNVVKQNKNIRELRKKKDSETIIRNQKGVTNGKEFIVNENIFDPYSLILILSEFDIPNDQSREFNIVDAGKSRVIEIKNLGTQTIKTPYGNKQGYTLAPIKNGQPVLKNKGDMEVTYVSIDDTLVPAKILIKLSSGVIELRLKKIRE